jgi:hypothetical protein
MGLPLEREELSAVWVDGRERLVCRSERGLLALVHLERGCSFDEAREALRRHGALLFEREAGTTPGGVGRSELESEGPAPTSLWRLAGRVDHLGQRYPEHAARAASISRLLRGKGSDLDRARVALIGPALTDDDVAAAISTVGVVALLVDGENPVAEAWFAEASRSLTRAGVP